MINIDPPPKIMMRLFQRETVNCKIDKSHNMIAQRNMNRKVKQRSIKNEITNHNTHMVRS